MLWDVLEVIPGEACAPGETHDHALLLLFLLQPLSDHPSIIGSDSKTGTHHSISGTNTKGTGGLFVHLSPSLYFTGDFSVSLSLALSFSLLRSLTHGIIYPLHTFLPSLVRQRAFIPLPLWGASAVSIGTGIHVGFSQGA